MAQIANLAAQLITNTGTGTLSLGAAVTGNSTLSDALPLSTQAHYTIVSGNDREVGTGQLTSAAVFERTTVETTLVGGVRDDTSPAAISVASGAELYISATNALLEHVEEMDQSVATTASPAFAGMTLTGQTRIGGGVNNITFDGVNGRVSQKSGGFSDSITVGSIANINPNYRLESASGRTGMIWELENAFVSTDNSEASFWAFAPFDTLSSAQRTGYYAFRVTLGAASSTDMFTVDLEGNVTSVGAVTGQDITVNGGFLNIGAATTLTIATGAVTATRTHHRIDTEGGGASDTLSTINGGTDGDLLMLRIVNNARTVTLDETGNIRLAGSTFVLSNTTDRILLAYDGTQWIAVSQSDNS